MDETLVVKHINEISIGHDSFSFVDKSIESNFIRRVSDEQIMMFDASKLD